MLALNLSIPLAAEPLGTPLGEGLLVWVVALAVLALMPFVLTMVTSFAKLVIVGGIVRQALGTQQVPPNAVITGLALILSIHVMWPVGEKIYAAIPSEARARLMDPADNPGETAAKRGERRMNDAADALSAARVPIREFLERNSAPANIRMFRGLADSTARRAAAKPAGVGAPKPDDSDAATGSMMVSRVPWIEELVVLTPAFVLTELTEAFKIGFLIFVPFLVLDLVVSNILLALGMQMLAPQTVSLPLKLMLFVLVDGWSVIIKGLVLSYH